MIVKSQATGPQGSVGPAGSFSHTNNPLTSTVTMTNANQWYTGSTVSVGPGTHMVYGEITFYKATMAQTTTTLKARVFNTTSSTELSIAEQRLLAPTTSQLLLQTLNTLNIVSIGATSTLAVQGLSVEEANVQMGSGGNVSTKITTIKIA